MKSSLNQPLLQRSSAWNSPPRTLAATEDNSRQESDIFQIKIIENKTISVADQQNLISSTINQESTKFDGAEFKKKTFSFDE